MRAPLREEITIRSPSTIAQHPSGSDREGQRPFDPDTWSRRILYDDLTEVHAAQVVVSLAAKGSAMVTVPFTVTDDINPQVSITEGADPIPLGIVLGAVLWSD